jgi:DNA-binding transcriptional LysR family regulator
MSHSTLFQQRGLSLDRLRSFLLVAEAGGIAKAAGPDAVRQSQFSRQIGELESFFEVELLRRVGRRTTLTAQGEALARVVREQFTGLSDFATECRSAPHRYALGAGDSILQWVVVPRLGQILKRLANASFALQNLRSRDIADALLAAQLDFGILRAARVRAPLKGVPIGTVRYALFVPKELWSPRWNRAHEKMMREIPWVTLGTEGEFLEQLESAAAKAKIELNLRLLTDSFPQAARAAMSGAFAAILPAHATADPLLKPLHCVAPAWLSPIHRHVMLAWNPRLMKVRSHADVALAELKRGLGTL